MEKYLDEIEKYIILSNPHCLNEITDEYYNEIFNMFFKLKSEIKNCENKIVSLEQQIVETTNKNYDV